MNPKIQQMIDLIPEIEGKGEQIDNDGPSSANTGFLDGREVKYSTKAILKDVQRLTRNDHLTHTTRGKLNRIGRRRSIVRGTLALRAVLGSVDRDP